MNSALFQKQVGYFVHKESQDDGGIEQVEQHPENGQDYWKDQQRGGPHSDAALASLARWVVHYSTEEARMSVVILST